MSIESMKMVVDLIQSLGAEGKEAFVWWLLVCHGTQIAMAGSLLVVLAYAVKTITRAVIAVNEDNQAIRRMRDMAGIGGPGYLDGSERVKVEQRFREMLRKEQQE